LRPLSAPNEDHGNAHAGVDQPALPLLRLAKHGCDADAVLSQAESLVRGYQDSPQRSAMLAALADARRKP